MANRHIILFPFLAPGHINPFVSFANLIDKQARCTVTFVSTPLNVVKVRSMFSDMSTTRFAALPFSSSDHGLPAGIENLDKLPSHLSLDFFRASLSLQPSFEQLVREIVQQNLDATIHIVADVFMGWTVESAKKLRVSHSALITSGAYGAAMFLSMCWHPPRAISGSDEVSLVDYPEVRFSRSRVSDTFWVQDEVHPIPTFIGEQLSLSFQSQGILVNTVAELEKVGLSFLERCPGLPIWPIGPLLRPPHIPTHKEEICGKWLDNHPPASVLYVSFGSQNTILSSQMMDLAMGLEASGKPFIWVLRTPLEFQTVGEFRDEWLPEGFENRMRENMQGLVVHGWAPQLDILSHASTGAFLSHCGWNSVQESLCAGVPIIGWPLVADQVFNSTMLEDLGVCVEVARGFSSNGVDGGWERVASTIELVMGGTRRANAIKMKAMEIKEVMVAALKGNTSGVMGSSLKAVEDFLRSVFPP